jgi:hypothetical protein
MVLCRANLLLEVTIEMYGHGGGLDAESAVV